MRNFSIDLIWAKIQIAITAIGGWLGYFLGGIDGLMIGRATYGNPWIFSQIRHYLETGEEPPMPDVKERVRVSKIHLQRSIEWKGEHIALLEIRKHWASYFKGLPNFKTLKMKLMETVSAKEALGILDEILDYYGTSTEEDRQYR